MADKRMLILPGEVVQKIDENRGDMSQAEFIELLIDNQLKDKEKDSKYATKEEVRGYQEDMKKLLRNFLDFFMAYGMDLGKQAPGGDLEELTSKLQSLQKDVFSEQPEKSGRATIKYK